MVEVVMISYKIGKSLTYVPLGDFDLKKGDYVIVSTENGIQIAVVKSDVIMCKSDDVLNSNYIIRLCNDTDLLDHKKNCNDAEKCLIYAKSLCKKMNLDMSFVDANYNLDRSQLVFSFVASTRIDFRELAKKLAQKYKTRIELRQIGVRDKAKKIGGLGPCGLFLCCNSFFNDFNSVSINMAKNQYLALNPSKINGVCGRLLCCLEYENDLYTELKKDLPAIGSYYETDSGVGKVVDVDVFKKSFSVDVKDKGIVKIINGDNDEEVK